MTLDDLATSDAAFLLDPEEGLGREVSFLRRGEATGVPVNVVPEFEQPQKDTAVGRETVRRGKLHVPTSLGVSPKDRWTIGDETWETESIGTVEAGLRVIHITRLDEEFRTRNRGVM